MTKSDKSSVLKTVIVFVFIINIRKFTNFANFSQVFNEFSQILTGNFMKILRNFVKISEFKKCFIFISRWVYSNVKFSISWISRKNRWCGAVRKCPKQRKFKKWRIPFRRRKCSKFWFGWLRKSSWNSEIFGPDISGRSKWTEKETDYYLCYVSIRIVIYGITFWNGSKPNQNYFSSVFSPLSQSLQIIDGILTHERQKPRFNLLFWTTFWLVF